MGDEAKANPTSSGSSRSAWLRLLRVPLRTVLLLMTLVASWLALRVSQAEKVRKTAQLAEAKATLAELQFDDETQFGLAFADSRHDNYDWQVFLPSGQQYELCWSGEQADIDELPTPAGTLPLKPGLHRVQLVASWRDQRAYLVTLTVDGLDTRLGECAQSGSRHDFLQDTGQRKYAKSSRLINDVDRVYLYQQPTDRPLEIIRGLAKDPFGSSFSFPGLERLKDDLSFDDFTKIKEQFEGPQGLLQGVTLWVRAIPP